MRLSKKQVLKEDGRYLIYYHNPETATPEQTAVFAAIDAPEVEVTAPLEKPNGSKAGNREQGIGDRKP